MKILAFFLIFVAFSTAQAEEDAIESSSRFGAELNPLGLIIDVYSASFSLFNQTKSVEWQFPVYYEKGTEDDYGAYKMGYADIQFRYYLNGGAKGFHAGAFTRFAHLRGYTGKLISGTATYENETKLGLGAELGYRYFFENDVYWGASVALGSYVAGESYTLPALAFAGNEEYIIDVELFKIGMLF